MSCACTSVTYIWRLIWCMYFICIYLWHALIYMYSQSHLGWHFRMLFQSSKLKARTCLFTETWQKRCSSFWTLSFRKFRPNIFCTSWGWMVGSWQKVLLFLIRIFLYRGPHFPIQTLVNFCGGGNWREIKRDLRRIVDEMVYRKVQQQFSQISGWISVGRENNLSQVIFPMSSRTQIQQRGKIQPLKTVELSEYEKIHYQIYMYRPRDCQRQKGCRWNIYVTTLDYTLSLAHGSIFILSGFPIFRYRCAQILM